MKTKTKTVTYRYCDFCKKRMVRRDAMIHHEDRCTMNPNRNCGLCQSKRNFKELLLRFHNETQGETKWEVLRWLDDKIKCPACILTVLRLSNRASEFTDLFKFAERMAEFNEEQEARIALAETYA